MRRVLAATLTLVLSVVLCAMVLLEAFEVVLRHGAGAGVFWAHESAVLMLQTLGWLGAARLWLDHEHLNLALFGHRFPRVRRRIRHGSDVLMIVGALWLLPKIIETHAVYQALAMASLPVSAGIRFVPPLVGIALLALAASLNLLCAVSSGGAADLRARSDRVG